LIISFKKQKLHEPRVPLARWRDYQIETTNHKHPDPQGIWPFLKQILDSIIFLPVVCRRKEKPVSHEDKNSEKYHSSTFRKAISELLEVTE